MDDWIVDAISNWTDAILSHYPSPQWVEELCIRVITGLAVLHNERGWIFDLIETRRSDGPGAKWNWTGPGESIVADAFGHERKKKGENAKRTGWYASNAISSRLRVTMNSNRRVRRHTNVGRIDRVARIDSRNEYKGETCLMENLHSNHNRTIKNYYWYLDGTTCVRSTSVCVIMYYNPYMCLL